ncbi:MULTISPECIES: hypothetical protein [Vibrio]|uniref:hypothetical protein n=1 Tax=Vibrio TaxID=662 RepID=UPI0015C554AF|nr:MULTISPECIES: hypothetical protein [Vibrio]MDF9401749.1 hypothetical protein [Vibrio sp. 1180_3]NGZ68270.1 hypothetical protein [Vibrio aestuarianus subsp. cardii]CAH8188154.1 conserved hypothetical protein [Vibrio aestuarianus]
MRKLVILGAVLGIAGCSMTPQKLRSTEPAFVVKSNQTSEQIAMCISDKWESTPVIGSSPIVSNKKTQAGYTVQLFIGGNLSHLADIASADSTEGKTVITTFSNTFAIGEDPSLKAVLDCQAQN